MLRDGRWITEHKIMKILARSPMLSHYWMRALPIPAWRRATWPTQGDQR